MKKLSYAEQIKRPEWQKRRLERLKISSFTCDQCGSSENELHVHHLLYKKKAMIWEYDNVDLAVLCSSCHLKTHVLEDSLKQEITYISYAEKLRLLGYVCSFNGPIRGDSKDVKEYQQGYADGKIGLAERICVLFNR